MKIATIIVRVLMGILFIFGSIAFFLKLGGEPQLEGNMKIYFDGFAASGYFLMLLKITELVCGVALVAGLSPIIVNIFFVHLFLDTKGLPIAIILVLANSFLGYAYWNKFKPMLEAK
jgi:putative oxidoreductase